MAEEQWQRAFELDPEVVFITGWNEWIAMQLNKKQGPAVFCDQFDVEFSRDVEMMKGGYGDNYYMQMAANIRRFKGMTGPSKASPSKSIEISSSFAQWQDVLPAYRDHVLDTLARDSTVTRPPTGDSGIAMTPTRKTSKKEAARNLLLHFKSWKKGYREAFLSKVSKLSLPADWAEQAINRSERSIFLSLPWVMNPVTISSASNSSMGMCMRSSMALRMFERPRS